MNMLAVGIVIQIYSRSLSWKRNRVRMWNQVDLIIDSLVTIHLVTIHLSLNKDSPFLHDFHISKIKSHVGVCLLLSIVIKYLINWLECRIRYRFWEWNMEKQSYDSCEHIPGYVMYKWIVWCLTVYEIFGNLYISMYYIIRTNIFHIFLSIYTSNICTYIIRTRIYIV